MVSLVALALAVVVVVWSLFPISVASHHGVSPAGAAAPGEVGKGGSESTAKDLDNESAAADPWLPIDIDVPERPPRLPGGAGRPLGCDHTSAGSA